MERLEIVLFGNIEYFFSLKIHIIFKNNYTLLSICFLFSLQVLDIYLMHTLIIRYRLAAVDHGQFSFIDIKHNNWPVALITNPKHALYMMPRRENLKSIVASTHVR